MDPGIESWLMEGYIRKILNSQVEISLHFPNSFLDSKPTSQESRLVLQNVQCPTQETQVKTTSAAPKTCK